MIQNLGGKAYTRVAAFKTGLQILSSSFPWIWVDSDYFDQ